MCYFCRTEKNNHHCECISSSTFIGDIMSYANMFESVISGMSNKDPSVLREIYCYGCEHRIENVGINNDPKYGDWPLSCASAMLNAMMIGREEQKKYLIKSRKNRGLSTSEV